MNYIIEKKSSFNTDFYSYLKENDYFSKHLFILADTNVQTLCWPLLSPIFNDVNFELITCKCGENNKNIEECNRIWLNLINRKCDRYSAILAFGGGLMCDMGGFIASTYKRGIPYILIPTTLLAQTDAAFGGKTGVNLMNIKNQIGTFSHPELVAIDTDFLYTLPVRQFRSGMAEIIKHGIIKDNNILKNICTDPSDDRFLDMLKKSVKVKIDIVQEDYYEKNTRKILNFGHTVGHAVESALMPEILHGEAVAFGMIAALILSRKYYHFNDEIFSYYVSIICKNVDLPSIKHADIGKIMKNIMFDKKNNGENINFVLLKDICVPITDISIDKSEVEETIAVTITLIENYKQ